MRKSWITLILLGLFLLEGAVLPWFMPVAWQGKVSVAPQFVLVVILYIALYSNRHLALAYGITFGLLQDFIFYGPMIGTNSFSMGLSAYLTGLALRRPHIHIVSSLFGIVVGTFLFENIHFGLYRLFRLIQVPYNWALLHEMLPSLLIDLLFALAIYVPARKLLEQMDGEKESAED